ncbi:monocarboxylate transporter 14 [Rhipicephalus microplus]|uniref:monocarboxylate transporter 14 n=1 Tax=Rhipicephalus microplus TaxID=6941 RepID=UPI003F6BDD2C
MPAPHLVDSLYAWLMAAMCFWIQIWVATIFRSAGVLLVGLVSAFRISREQAAWPFEICNTINLAQGFLVGILVRYFDTRALNSGATLVSGVSAITCSLWDTPSAYLVFLGFIFGAGSGLMIPTSVVVLNRYFDVYRASASGLSFAEGALSSILLPPLIGMLMDTYGLQGTMLIVGALMLNTMAGSIELRSSPSFPRPLVLPVISSTFTRCSSSKNSQSKNIISYPLVWDSGIVVSSLPPRSSAPQRRSHRGVRLRI